MNKTQINQPRFHTRTVRTVKYVEDRGRVQAHFESEEYEELTIIGKVQRFLWNIKQAINAK